MILHKFKILKEFIKKQYHLKILKRKYFRLGSCAKCGECCKNIYIRHKDKLIKSKEDFELVKQTSSYDFYKHIKVIDKDDFGLIFECEWYDKEKKLCKNHKKRPSICRNYPSEEIFSFGACLHENCGFYFKPIVSFEEIFKKIQTKTNIK